MIELRLQLDSATEQALREIAQRQQLSLEQACLQALSTGLHTLAIAASPDTAAMTQAPGLPLRPLMPGGPLTFGQPIDMTQVEVLGTLSLPRPGPDGTIRMRSPIIAPGPVAPKPLIPLDDEPHQRS